MGIWKMAQAEANRTVHPFSESFTQLLNEQKAMKFACVLLIGTSSSVYIGRHEPSMKDEKYPGNYVHHMQR